MLSEKTFRHNLDHITAQKLHSSEVQMTCSHHPIVALLLAFSAAFHTTDYDFLA